MDLARQHAVLARQESLRAHLFWVSNIVSMLRMIAAIQPQYHYDLCYSLVSFMWQMCGYIPSTLAKEPDSKQVPLMAAKLTASFVLETLIHAKEKVSIHLAQLQPL